MPGGHLNQDAAGGDALPSFARADLEGLKLAAEAILRVAADDVLPAPLEAELTIFAERVGRALLSAD